MSGEPPPLPECTAGPPPLPESETTRPARRGGWWAHLILLGSYPLVLGVLGLAQTSENSGPMLPRSTSGLLAVSAVELALFSALFTLVWICSRVNAEQLHLHWRGGPLPLLRGFGYSIGLRFVIGVVTVGVLAIGALTGSLDRETIMEAGPDLEALVDSETLKDNPAYLLVSMTVLSFIVAGLREELWRAGFLAALIALFPKTFSSVRGKVAAVAFAAIIFGLGHLPQGWMAVGMIGLLGFGLGLILVFHRSLWDAVLAHGFFDAASFALLYLIANMPPELMKQWGMGG